MGCVRPFVADHLAYMNKLEAEGHLWASGPFIEEGVLVGDGLTILLTPTIEEAERVMKDEPLIKRFGSLNSKNGSFARGE
jgi:uncharacterized protein